MRKKLRVRIDGDVFTGTGSEIMERLRLLSVDPGAFPATEHYIRWLAARFTAETGLTVALPETNDEDMADAMLRVLARAGRLELSDYDEKTDNPDEEQEETKKGESVMTVRIDGTTYEGTGEEIMERLRLRTFDPSEYPDVKSYILQLRANFTRATDLDCPLPETGTEDMARAMIARLAEVGGLEVVENG